MIIMDYLLTYLLTFICEFMQGLVLAMQATQLILACKMKLHRIVTFLACAIMLQCLGMVCLLCEKVWYASTGVDSFWLSFFAQLLPQIAETIVLFDLILMFQFHQQYLKLLGFVFVNLLYLFLYHQQ